MSLVLAEPSTSDLVVDTADLLPFQRDIVKELLAHDGVSILGEGLGASAVVASLVAVDDALLRQRALGDPPYVTLIVGATDEAKVSVKERLAALFPRASRPAAGFATRRAPAAQTRGRVRAGPDLHRSG